MCVCFNGADTQCLNMTKIQGVMYSLYHQQPIPGKSLSLPLRCPKSRGIPFIGRFSRSADGVHRQATTL